MLFHKVNLYGFINLSLYFHVLKVLAETDFGNKVNCVFDGGFCGWESNDFKLITGRNYKY